jgi:phage major head subunit gpT-like protein
MMNLKNDQGMPLGVMPTHLVYPPSLESAALTLLNAQFDASGASNIWYKTVKPLMVPWLV